MTKQKAIKILEAYCQYANKCSQGWIKLSESLKTPDIKDIARGMGETMQRDSEIIKSAIDELKHPRKTLSDKNS